MSARKYQTMRGKSPARLSTSNFTETGTGRKSAEKPLVSTCYVLPVFKSAHVLDDELEVNKNVIKCVDRDKKVNTRTSNSYVNVEYDKVLNDPHEFAKYAYNTNIDPLAKAAIEGDSTLAVFGGVTGLPTDTADHNSSKSHYADSTQTNHFLHSQTVVQSLVCQATGQLLNAVNIEGNKTGTVTFSWYRIEATSPEIITDMLKTASLSAQKGGVPTADNSLLLRELGKGRGMIVPGLWEVEVFTGTDVEAVVNHVHKSVPMAQQGIGTSHVVMQLTVTNSFKQQQAQLAKSSRVGGGQLGSSGYGGSSAGNITLPHGDGPGIGRIGFVLLSNVSPAGLPLCPTMPPPPSSASSSVQSPAQPPTVPPPSSPRPVHAWVDHLYTVAQWLENKRASPAFHKSRILLLLRDVFYKRQTASIMLLLRPIKEMHSDNTHWMKIGAKIASSSRATTTTTTTTTPYPSSNSGGPDSPLRYSEPQEQIRAGSLSPTPREAYKQAMQIKVKHGGKPPPPPAHQQDPTATTTSSTTAMATAASANSGALVSCSASVTSGNHPNSGMARKKTGLFPSRTPVTSTEGYVEDFATSEAMAALQMALEASRSECAALKVAYQYAQDKYNDVKEQYDSLLLQLKEEGAMLTKRDKERYKSAVKDLKDYEIYKQVMETAMVRLQAEMEAVVQENNSLKTTRTTGDRKVLQQKGFAERYGKDLTVTKKKLTDVEAKVVALEKQVKQVTKDRDVAVQTLAQVKSVGSQREGQLRMTTDLKIGETEELKRTVAMLEERNRAIQVDKDSILASSSNEVETLRQAHSKALEMLMSYQEENDLMRAAVSEMTEKREQQEAVASASEEQTF